MKIFEISKGRRMTEKTRIEWLDILKLLGMIAIFCGHFGAESGRLHVFVFYYHVPLFFFASGIFAGNSDQLSFKDAMKKRFGQIMVPYVFLVIINMVVIVVTSSDDLITYIKYVKQFIWGIRNQMPTAALWFFPCIFCTGVLFDVLRRVCRKDILIFFAAVVLYVVSVTLFPNRPDVQPSWIWNIDSACHYMIYYALGYVMRKKLTGGDDRTAKESDEKYDRKKRYLLLVGAVLVTVYALTVYVQEDIAGRLLLRMIPAAGMIYPVLRAVLLIGFHMVLAKILEGFRFLSYAGTQTLWLCGNESVVKAILNAAAGLVGLQIEIVNEFSALMYAVVMTVVIITGLLPIEQRLYRKSQEYLAELKFRRI